MSNLKHILIKRVKNKYKIIQTGNNYNNKVREYFLGKSLVHRSKEHNHSKKTA